MFKFQSSFVPSTEALGMSERYPGHTISYSKPPTSKNIVTAPEKKYPDYKQQVTTFKCINYNDYDGCNQCLIDHHLRKIKLQFTDLLLLLLFVYKISLFHPATMA